MTAPSVDAASAKVRLVFNTLKFVVLALLALWVVFAVAHHLLEPQYGWVSSFDWAQYTMTTNGEGTYVPTHVATKILTMLLRPAAVVATVIATAHVVNNTLEQPHLFSDGEQDEVLYLLRKMAEDRGIPAFVPSSDSIYE